MPRSRTTNAPPRPDVAALQMRLAESWAHAVRERVPPLIDEGAFRDARCENNTLVVAVSGILHAARLHG